MLNAIHTAADAMDAQVQRIENVARAIATPDATAGPDSGGAPATAVRIGALPVGVSTAGIVTLVEAENAYRLNAVVLETASDMLETLLEAVD